MAAVIFVVVTGLAGVFLVRQTVYTQRTQAIANAQANLRMAMEIVTADLFNAGSRGVALPCAWTGNALRVGTGTSFRDVITELRFCSSYGDGAVNATYRIQNDPANGNVPTLWRAGAPAVPGIVAFEIDLDCAPSGTLPGCVDAGTNAVFATFRLIARSLEPLRGYESPDVAFGGADMASLRDAGVIRDDFFYASSERRLALPNFGGK